MGQNKQQLEILLHFIKALYDNPENKEFAIGLHKIVERDIDGNVPKIQNIEKYLSLDYNIDEICNVDYSFIEDDEVREKLNSDFREMRRFQFGTRGHKIDFAEFCRFATLQIELLVNLYFDKKYNSDIEKIKQELLSEKHIIQPNGGISLISDIALRTKIFALKKAFEWKNSDISNFLHIVEVRNRQSHRSLIIYSDNIKQTEDTLKSEGVMSDNGYIDYNKAKKVVGQKLINDYNFEKWYDEMPFEKIVSGISRLAVSIKSSLG